MKNLTKKQKVVIALKIAKDLNLNHYTSGAYVRNAEGQAVGWSNRHTGCSWCAIGAANVARAYLGLGIGDGVLEVMYGVGLNESANDGRPKRLPELWDRAIALAEEAGQ